jgi:hypothetical protein
MRAIAGSSLYRLYAVRDVPLVSPPALPTRTHSMRQVRCRCRAAVKLGISQRYLDRIRRRACDYRPAHHRPRTTKRPLTPAMVADCSAAADDADGYKRGATLKIWADTGWRTPQLDFEFAAVVFAPLTVVCRLDLYRLNLSPANRCM